MKKLMVMMAMMVAGGAAVADYAYLYWEVDPTGVTGEWAWWFKVGREFDYAQLRAVDQGGNVVGEAIMNYDASLQPAGGVANVYSTDDGPSLTTEAPVFGQIRGDGFDYASTLYGFVVEAYLEGAANPLWTSGVSWYDDLVRGNHVWEGDPSAMSGDISSMVFMVPEPTSGLLLLLGLAGLALKRKRVVV